MWHKRPFVPLPAKSFNSALEEQFALIAFERVNICSSLTPIGRCQVLVYMCKCVCVFTYHCSIVEGRRRCPRGPAPSGPSGPVRSILSVRSRRLGPRALERTGRTGPDRAGTARWPSLAWPCPVRSGPLQCRTPGPDGPDRTGRDPRSPHLFSFEKRLSVAPKQAFGQKVMECCSKTGFWTKSDGVLLQSNILP